jgi:hypothetical protein
MHTSSSTLVYWMKAFAISPDPTIITFFLYPRAAGPECERMMPHVAFALRVLHGRDPTVEFMRFSTRSMPARVCARSSLLRCRRSAVRSHLPMARGLQQRTAGAC